MYSSGDAAEQIVRMSLQGVEVAAKITGNGAINIAKIINTIMKNGSKQNKGKSRLSNMLKSGKELKVFTVKNEDLKKFQQEAKRYGVLYCVLKDKDNNAPDSIVDVITRTEDSTKINRIVERFNLSSVDTATIVSEVEKGIDKKTEPQIDIPVKDEADKLLDEVLIKPIGKEDVTPKNPSVAKTEKSPPSEPILKQEKLNSKGADEKPSVREKIKNMQNARKENEKNSVVPELKEQKKNAPQTTTHKQPKNKKKYKKSKER